MTRRRLDLPRLNDQILRLFYEKFFDDEKQHIPFSEIRNGLPTQPTNAIRLELQTLIDNYRIIQKTETRTRVGPLGSLNPNAPTYEEKVDGYIISKNGIAVIDQFDDEYYAQLFDDPEKKSVDELSDEEDSDGVWQPLPLDRQDPYLNAAIQKIDDLAENVRTDNGYNVHFGEERKLILDQLNAVSKRLKEEASISWMYIREFALKPIAVLVKRFGTAAIGVAAETAKAAIKEWLKKKGLNFLEGL
jgi:hypothetical protein